MPTHASRLPTLAPCLLRRLPAFPPRLTGRLARILADNSAYGVYTESRAALEGIMNSVAGNRDIA